MLGTRDDIAKVARGNLARDLVIAIPSAPSSTIRELRALAEEAGLHPMVVPPLSQLVGHNPSAADIREIHLEDLLGRRPVQLDESAIAESLTQRRVLVTGAGGSIGSELCRQIAKYGPERLVLLDRDESALHALQITLDGHGLLSTDTIVLADIRDPEALRRVFLDHRPEVVFHAAALKHLPLLERYPLEGWQTNVLGTLNVLRAAAESGSATFVNISTDKAADPTSVLGYTKRIAERLTARFAATERWPTSASASATSSGRGARSSRPSRRRSGAVGRSPSPIPRSSATSCSSPRPASSSCRPRSSAPTARSWCSTWASR